MFVRLTDRLTVRPVGTGSEKEIKVRRCGFGAEPRAEGLRDRGNAWGGQQPLSSFLSLWVSRPWPFPTRLGSQLALSPKRCQLTHRVETPTNHRRLPAFRQPPTLLVSERLAFCQTLSAAVPIRGRCSRTSRKARSALHIHNSLAVVTANPAGCLTRTRMERLPDMG